MDRFYEMLKVVIYLVGFYNPKHSQKLQINYGGHNAEKKWAQLLIPAVSRRETLNETFPYAQRALSEPSSRLLQAEKKENAQMRY